MADLSDVEIALATAISSAVYPDGPSLSSIVGVPCRIYRGWPMPASLNADLAAGSANITVFPAAEPGEILDPYFDAEMVRPRLVGLTASVAGQDVTFSGSINGDEAVGLLVDGHPYIYEIDSRDGASNIAANIAALLAGDRLAFYSGATLTVPGAASLAARVVAKASVIQSMRRERRDIQIICWCPNATMRDTLAKALDLALSAQSFRSLADGTAAKLRYKETKVFDQSQSASLFRRDLIYKCEYSVTRSMSRPVMVFGEILMGGSEIVT